MPFADPAALSHILYFSRATPQPADMGRTLLNILNTARARNHEKEITGALIACDMWFVQVLEGSRIAIGETYQRVCMDRRHRDVTMIAARPINKRRFSGWAMCGASLSPTDEAIVRTLATRRQFDPRNMNATSALRLLATVRDVQARHQPSVEL